MIRLIIAGVFVFFFLTLTMPMMAVTYFIKKKHPDKADHIHLTVVQWAFTVVWKICGVTLKVNGLDNIPRNTGVLYVANHQGMFDIVTAYSVVPCITGFISKDSVLKVPLLSLWMKRLHCIFLKRNDPRAGLDMILECIDSIKKGISIFIFPEGTRNKNPEGELLEFKPGSVKMASKTDCPIIPVAISGTRDIFENAPLGVRKGTVNITFGQPIIPSSLDEDKSKHLAAYTREVITDLLKN